MSGLNTDVLFDNKSDIYAKSRPQYPKALYDWLVSVCPSRECVWDVGCGNGQASIDLAKFFCTVEATDVSPSQIENAPLIKGVTFSVQKAGKTAFADNMFDAICVAQALHWFDYDEFWPEVKRVLKPNGVFCAWGYVWPSINKQIDALLEKKLLSVVRPYWAPQNKLLWDGYIDVSFPFAKRLKTPNLKMSVSWSIDEFFAFLHSWSATRLYMEDKGDAFFQQCYQAILPFWLSHQKKTISMDFVMIAAVNDG